MAHGNISIGEAELEIMKVVWDAGEAVTSLYISEAVEAMGWKRTTILTFLSRLVEKGALSAKKVGKLYYYTPLITRRDYRRSKTGELIKNLYHGSIRELAVSLFEEQNITEDDIRELRSIFADDDAKKPSTALEDTEE